MVHAFFIALGVSFTSIFTAELGDKTQLFTFLLGTHFSNRKWLLLLSVFTGMGLVTLIGFGIATLFQTFIETTILQIVGGSVFILIGVITLIKTIRDRLKKEEACDITEEEEKLEDKIMRLANIKNPFLFVSFLTVLYILMELGDKSQIMVLMLFATHNWVGVFTGAMLAFLLLNGAGIFFAIFVRKICENNPVVVSIFAGLLSIGLGIWMIIG